MKPGAGKNKGGEYERKICAILSLWISNGQRDDLLCRTVGSGAQFTKSKRGVAADLMANDPLAIPFCSKFVVECKHWKDLEFIRFLFQEGELFDALVKVQKEALDKEKSWMLIAKQNNRKDLIFISHTTTESENCHMLFRGAVKLFRLEDFLLQHKAEDLLK